MSRSLVVSEDIDAEVVLSDSELNKCEREAQKHYLTSQHTSVQFAAELRKLQDSGAHLRRGYRSFGDYAEHIFEGLSASNAMQISRQGRVLLILEKTERLDLSKAHTLPGTTGVRDLCVILKKYGQETMLAIFDHASATGRKITSETVTAATLALIKPETAELGDGSEENGKQIEEDEEEGYDERHSDILDRIGWLREVIDDISDAISADRLTLASRHLKSLEEELVNVKKEIENVEE